MEPLVQNQGYLYAFSGEGFSRDKENNSLMACSLSCGKRTIRILIADDHPYLIHGVETDLARNPNIKIVGTANSYDEVISKTRKLEPDLILLDLKMPGWSKYDLKEYICNLKEITRCKVVIFSNETGWGRIHKCLDIGASAYIEKAISIGRLEEFIIRICESDELVIFTAEELPQVRFSKRQREVLHCIAEGKENIEIAGILKIDIKTVHSYINEIKRKFSESFGIHPVKPRTFMFLASKLGFGYR